jgi:predicted acetyltransferase
MIELVTPALQYLPSYIQALQSGWIPNEMRPESGQEALGKIAQGEAEFIHWLNDSSPGQTIPLPDGTLVPRLPFISRWLWDGEFCGSIQFRWQEQGGRVIDDLPDYCLGHVGYGVLPWKQRQGMATQALGLMLPIAREQGLRVLQISTQPINRASQRVIEANGGQFMKAVKPPVFFAHPEEWVYHINLEK